MVEYHFDACNMFLDKWKKRIWRQSKCKILNRGKALNHIWSWGVHLSTVCTFEESWVAPNGHVLVLEEEGQGIMESAFQSQEFSSGLDLSQEQIAEVNHVHCGLKSKSSSWQMRNCLKIRLTWQSIQEGIWVWSIRWRLLVLWTHGVTNGGLHWCPKGTLSDVWTSFLFDHFSGHDR